MFQRIAAATVIRGEGECQAYINGIASAEIRRQSAQMRHAMEGEAERARMLEASRNRLLTRMSAERKREARKRPGLLRRLQERAVDAYAIVMATVIVWGMKLGLLEEDREQ